MSDLVKRLRDGCNLQQSDGERAADRIEELEAALRWNKTADGLPKKPGKRNYEQIECLIMLPNGDLEISVWNCEHEVWDDAEGDDYRYDPEHPVLWLELAQIRKSSRAALNKQGETK